MTPAERIIVKCGGAPALAKLAGVDVSRVYRWTHPKDKGGSGGRIPTTRQQRILERAREQGIDLTPADFFEGEA